MTDTTVTICESCNWHPCRCGTAVLPLPVARGHQPPTFATYLSGHERDQLDARAAAAEQERDEALEERDFARDQAKAARDDYRQQLGRAQEFIAVVDDVTEQLDRARALLGSPRRAQARSAV